jgi:uncharacterized protein (DUF488 family)
MTIFTIGYEGRALDELVGILVARKIDRVLDVRILPLSRRRGFSKTPLRTALEAAGIDYVHLREAGNPFRKDPDALKKYKAYLPEEAVQAVRAAAKGHRAALLCVEAEAHDCHRSAIAARLGGKVIDL